MFNRRKKLNAWLNMPALEYGVLGILNVSIQIELPYY